MKSAFVSFEPQTGLVLYKIPAFEEAGCKAIFSSRIGGLSSEPYKSLNLGLHVGDEKKLVIANRERVCQSMGWDLNSVVCGEQTHGDKIVQVDDLHKGKGAYSYNSSLADTDALMTNRKGIVLATFYADCVPIYIFDTVKRVVALAHAGWKGTCANIGPKTMTEMNKVYETRPENCLVGIGPSIGPCCYEVEELLLHRFKEQNFWWEDVFKAKGSKKWLLDLWESNRIQMVKAGVREENVITARICTSCNREKFFSYRQENGRTGRMGAFISLS